MAVMLQGSERIQENGSFSLGLRGSLVKAKDVQVKLQAKLQGKLVGWALQQ